MKKPMYFMCVICTRETSQKWKPLNSRICAPNNATTNAIVSIILFFKITTHTYTHTHRERERERVRERE